MGTSNWQNIPFCVEALMKIAPQRVLDVGVGFGRWGIVVREFCDVWYGRVQKSQWSVRLEGIEAYEPNITQYHAAFYDQIHLGDAKEIIPALEGRWDVVIFGDVLEHFDRQTGENLLACCLERADYVLVNIPLGPDWMQGDAYENPYERHLSAWVEADFDAYHLCRKALFFDYIERPFGSFILSRDDPKNLRQSLFSKNTQSNLQAPAVPTNSKDMYLQALQIRNEQLVAELNFIKGSRGYRLLERLKRLPFIDFFVKVGKWLMPGSVPPPASAPVPVQTVVPVEQPHEDVSPASATIMQAPAQAGHAHRQRTHSDQEWLLRQRQHGRPLSVNHPEWRGIFRSALELFDNVYALPDNLDEERALYYAELFGDAAPPSITVQGFPISYYHLVKALKRVAPQIPLFVIWHGNLLHSKEDYAWESFNLVRTLYEEGDIEKVGFVKKGMAEVFTAAGIKSQFVMNLIRQIPAAPSQPLGDGKHIGIWAEPDWGWKKLPYAMLASLGLIPQSVGHVHNISPRAMDFGKLMRIDAKYDSDPLSHAQVMEKLPLMHLNMYVSLTECAPMLPLESLSVGSPCLFGPTSHYFLDHDYLHSRLVVPYPDNAHAIAMYANRAIEERHQIIQAYIDYAPGYNQRALAALVDFLGQPVG